MPAQMTSAATVCEAGHRRQSGVSLSGSEEDDGLRVS
eukprot:SAG11_NODE_38653_length_251_cov_1.000000_1_plen_36_part_10